MNPDESDIDIDLNEYWRILKKRRGVALSIFLGSVLAAGYYNHRTPPLYKAHITLRFSSQNVRIPSGLWTKFLVKTGASTVETEIATMKLDDVLGRVAEKMQWPLERTRQTYTVSHIRNSDLVMITALAESPAAAIRLANVAAEAITERDIEEKTREAQTTLKELTARRQVVEEALTKLEKERQTFLEGHHATGQGPALSKRMLDMESQRREDLKTYTPHHPKIIKLDERIRETKEQLSRLPSQDAELGRLTRDIKVNENLYIDLARMENEARVTLESVGSYFTITSKPTLPAAPSYPRKKRNLALGAVLGAMVGILIVLLLETSDRTMTRVDQIEKLLGVPVLGVIPHLQLRDWADLVPRRFRSQAANDRISRSLVLSRHRFQSSLIERHHSLRTNIQSRLDKPETMVLTFTSAEAGEGKTITAINFCLAASQAGIRTLLIEADLRRASLHKWLGIPRDPGFVDALRGRLPWQKVVRSTVDFLTGRFDLDAFALFPGIENFHVMSGWATTPHIVDVLSSPRFPTLLSELRGHFKLIVLDCTPVLYFVDGLLVGAHSDGTILVYRSGHTAREALKRAKEQIENAKGTVPGVVLNDLTTPESEWDYRYYGVHESYDKREKEEIG